MPIIVRQRFDTAHLVVYNTSAERNFHEFRLRPREAFKPS